MSPLAFANLGLLSILAAEWWALPTPALCWAIAATFVVAAGVMAYSVVCSRTRWLVPTVFRGPRSSDRLAITFDDGPDPVFTPQVLDLLREHGVEATFFMVGRRAEAHPDLVRRVHDEGHQLGSHTYTHANNFHFLSTRLMVDEIQRGIDAVKAACGTAPVVFRPPLGLRTPRLRRALAALPQPTTCFTWTARGCDAIGRSTAEIVARLRPALTAGSILALHDGTGLGGTADRSPTLQALQELLPEIRARRLRGVRLDELLHVDAATVTAERRSGAVVVKVLLGSVFVAYPILVWFGLEHESPRVLAVLLLAIIVPATFVRVQRQRRAALAGLAAAPLLTVAGLVLSAWLDSSAFLLAVPVVISAAFLWAFGTSLRAGAMPMVERFARLQDGDLSPEKQAWCRLWTIIWSVFFVTNGSTALVLALAAPLSWWSCYNGGIAYVLMGLLFGGEWTMRHLRFSRAKS